LTAVIGDRNRPQKHVQRARIVLNSDGEPSVIKAARLAEAGRPAVWRWQHRFAEEGVDGLLRDKTRPPGKQPLAPATVAKILALPCTEPPGEATHWTGRAVPAGKVIHAICDNYATHKHPKVKKWLADHPRWVFHFTPTSASWINAVENFFSVITRRRLKRGVFKSVSELESAIKCYIKEHNTSSRPFVWTKPAEAILAAIQRRPEPSV